MNSKKQIEVEKWCQIVKTKKSPLVVLVQKNPQIYYGKECESNFELNRKVRGTRNLEILQTSGKHKNKGFKNRRYIRRSVLNLCIQFSNHRFKFDCIKIEVWSVYKQTLGV